MIKQALIKICYEQDHEAFKAYREKLAEFSTIHSNRDGVPLLVDMAEKELDAANGVYHESATVENFEAMAEALNRFNLLTAAFHRAPSASTVAENQFIASEETTNVLLEALKVAKGRLAKKLSELNSEDERRASELGVPFIENAAWNYLREYHKELAEAVLVIGDWTELEIERRAGVGVHKTPWNKFSKLVYL